MLLAGDNGATKTQLALFASPNDLRAPLATAKLPSAGYESFTALVRAFLTDISYPITRAVFGIAGPVLNGRVKVTSLPWIVDARQLQEDLAIPEVHLLNDLEVIAHAVPVLTPCELFTLNAGTPVPRAPIAVAAVGTGLGEAFLLWNGARYQVYPSEGGLANVAPINAHEAGLLTALFHTHSHVSYDFLCGGVGLPHIYAFLKETSGLGEPQWLATRLNNAHDPTPVIVKAALDDVEPLCVETLKLFASLLGAETGNMALRMLATGGVYIGGGIPPYILPFLQSDAFMQAFTNKGQLSTLLASIPVHVILNEMAGVIGAATYGFTL
ncbi:glucokinase [Reticulibacter mediterranei]|uniref:Glucokinase n=1 Tax=Reticulibacter mediterranei TaxID=2778369 RepID=A0A8J3N234_9CHLR|nr:glucokinase [Reticulibacter mediterranei]GHO94987.1 glucokinase [Reticulibacter mediterranei]